MSEYAEGSPIVLPDDPSFGPEVQLDYPGYRSTQWRAPKRKLASLPEEFHDLGGPVFGDDLIEEHDHDLTHGHPGEPLGERIIVSGTLQDEDGRPLPGALIEIWQSNACGRYHHIVDQHPAPLDPNFSGGGRCLTDSEGRYRFVTIKPGAYPWGNHENAWRPAHIHFSIFGRAFVQRLVTQMYFPGRPAVRVRPDLHLGARPEGARAADRALRHRGHAARVGARVRLGHRPRPRRERRDADGERTVTLPKTASQTVGPVLHARSLPPAGERARRPERRGRGAADRAARTTARARRSATA